MGVFVLTATLFAAGTMAAFTAGLEWEHYRRYFWSLGIILSIWDRLVLVWLLWWKSLVLFVPLLVVSGVLAAFRRRRLATASFLLGWTAIAFWLAADLLVQKRIGTHALEFVPYLLDAASMPLAADHTEWAGDLSHAMAAAAGILFALAAGGVVIWHVSGRLVQRLAMRWKWLAGARGCLVAVGILAVAIGGIEPARRTVTSSFILRHAEARLPVDVGGIRSCGTAIARAAGWSTPRRDWKVGVRIVSLLPDPAGDDPGNEEVHLHNFTGTAVNLDGWCLSDESHNRFRLSGELPALSTRLIKLPPGVMPLENTCDTVELHDAAGTEVHSVFYTEGDVKYGSLVSYREAADYDAFEQRLDTRVKMAYKELFDDLQRPGGVDTSAVFDGSSAPNVIYIVLESFRHSAVSPQVMPRLDRWGQGGIRFKRHYAGSNSSHFGLFTLLYSRSPLVYDQTLDAKVPPQTVYSLRESGYECHFLTSGDCRGFRRMGEFLSEDYFHSITTESGQSWRDWPQRDHRTLAHIRKLATEPSSRPRFVMAFLMTTHFPYPFPAQFDRHRPSGEEVSRATWKRTDPVVLYNRYKNAAAYLDHEIGELIDSLDPKRNIIVVTGDHGESMSEDGALAHASRPSQVQLRVPLLMVGPGLPAMTIDTATMHADVLPTLLHALKGHSEPIHHTLGRDVLDGGPLDDEVMICAYRWNDPLDLLLMRGDDRLLFKIRRRRAEIKVYGFCDERANLDLATRAKCTPDDALEWAAAFRDELSRIAR